MKLTKLVPIIVFSIFIISTITLTVNGIPFLFSAYWVASQIVGQYVEIPIENFYMRKDVVVLSILNFIAYMLLLAYASSVFYSYFSSLKISKIFKRLKIKRLKAHVILAIEDNFGVFLAKELKERSVPFVLIEKRKKNAELLSSKYLVINGSATDKEVLEEAGIKKATMLIAATKTPFENSLIVVTAKSMNPRIYAIARANSIEETQRLYRCGANSVIIPEINGAYDLAKQLLLV